MDFARTAIPNLKKLLRQQERERFSDASDDRTLPRIFVIHVRYIDEHADGWIELGVAQLKYRLTVGHVQKIRRSLKLDVADELKLTACCNRDKKARRVRQWTIGT